LAQEFKLLLCIHIREQFPGDMSDAASDAGLKQKKKKKLGKQERKALREQSSSDNLLTSAVDDGTVKTKKNKVKETSDLSDTTSTKTKEAKEDVDAEASDAHDAEGRSRRKIKTDKFVLEPNSASKLPVAEEDERRSMQREITKLVVRLRAEGKTKQEIEMAKRDLKHGLGKTLRKPDSSRVKKAEAWKQEMAMKDAASGQNKMDEKKKEALEHKHDVVVIPVIWRGRHDHQEIEKAAAEIKACLSQQGLDVWVDSRRQYTPGQKFAHWEFRGVMLRVEIGPEDYQAGMMQVCRAKEAGDYKSVEKRRLRLPPRGTRRVLLTLKEWGLTQIDIEKREADDDSDEDAPATSADDKSKKREADDLGGNWEPRASEDPKKKKRRTA